MKTRTLRALETSLEDERRHLEASALTGCGQEAGCRQRARRIVSILASLRTEITARADTLPRNPVEAQHFDEYLQRALEIHLELEPVDGAMQRHHAA